MNLPNAITLGRIFLVPLLVVVLFTKFDGWQLYGVNKEVLGALIFAVASLTDWLDGYVARRRKQVTGLGRGSVKLELEQTKATPGGSVKGKLVLSVTEAIEAKRVLVTLR